MSYVKSYASLEWTQTLQSVRGDMQDNKWFTSACGKEGEPQSATIKVKLFDTKSLRSCIPST